MSVVERNEPRRSSLRASTPNHSSIGLSQLPPSSSSLTSVLQLLVYLMQLFTGAVNREASIDPHAIVVSLARPGAHLLVQVRQGADPLGSDTGW